MHKPLAQALVIIAAAAVASDEPSSGRRLAARRGRRRPATPLQMAIVLLHGAGGLGVRLSARSRVANLTLPASTKTVRI